MKLRNDLKVKPPKPSSKGIRMISKKETQDKVRNSVYWGTDTKLLVEQKSQELQLSQNRLTEICLQRYLPSMQWN